MEITINGKPADITLESEKTVAELLAGIGQWLSGSGFSLSGLEIDGKSYGSLSLETAFPLPLDGLSLINIKTSSWADLLLEALAAALQGLELFEKANEDERRLFAGHWPGSAPARYLEEHENFLYTQVLGILGGPTSPPQEAISAVILLVAERIREMENPAGEMKIATALAEEIAGRLEDLPLDMQTGKDSKAAGTIAVFSSFVEKIFRLIILFKYFKTDIDSIEVVSMSGKEKQSLKEYLGEFSAALKELIAAFENKDTVLVGDLSEYELAPRLRVICQALNACNPGEKP